MGGHNDCSFILGGWPAPPPSSREQACNEMEMLSELPGFGPGLCSADRVASAVGVWPCPQHGSNNSSPTVYQLARAIYVADSVKCQSAQQLEDGPGE